MRDFKTCDSGHVGRVPEAILDGFGEPSYVTFFPAGTIPAKLTASYSKVRMVYNRRGGRRSWLHRNTVAQ